ncbi:MAG: hypothetical protein HY927_01615 [Elusimicrobia bacterium]|nr:hypothetical protein [Elusimicrobiota bacterium]
MGQQVTSLLGSEEIGITFTDKAVTPWGGMVLFSGLARQVGLEEALRTKLEGETLDLDSSIMERCQATTR